MRIRNISSHERLRLQMPGGKFINLGTKLRQYAASQRFSAVVFVSLSRVIAALNSSGP